LAAVTPNLVVANLEHEVLELDSERASERATGECEEVLFVLAGRGVLRLAGTDHALELESGAYLAPGESYELRNDGAEPLRLISVRIPDPAPPAQTPNAAVVNRTVVRRLADQEARGATTDREFRIVADPSTGLRSATQFVGYIPTAKAPDHFHTYDEVIYVLDGEGVFHAAGEERALEPGAAVELPARTVHCLQNTGAQTMRVLAVFRPAGSPAAAYYPDGTPAHADAPALDIAKT
jgi:mannose-6-phosphate isomerase-like protein (cupin superfamily)